MISHMRPVMPFEASPIIALAGLLLVTVLTCVTILILSILPLHSRRLYTFESA